MMPEPAIKALGGGGASRLSIPLNFYLAAGQ